MSATIKISWVVAVALGTNTLPPRTWTARCSSIHLLLLSDLLPKLVPEDSCPVRAVAALDLLLRQYTVQQECSSSVEQLVYS